MCYTYYTPRVTAITSSVDVIHTDARYVTPRYAYGPRGARLWVTRKKGTYAERYVHYSMRYARFIRTIIRIHMNVRVDAG